MRVMLLLMIARSSAAVARMRVSASLCREARMSDWLRRTVAMPRELRGHETPFHNQRPLAKGREVCSGPDEPRCLPAITARDSCLQQLTRLGDLQSLALCANNGPEHPQ